MFIINTNMTFFHLLIQELKNIEKAEIYLSERDFMDIIFTLAKAGYSQYVQNILEKIKFSKESIPGNVFLQVFWDIDG